MIASKSAAAFFFFASIGPLAALVPSAAGEIARTQMLLGKTCEIKADGSDDQALTEAISAAFNEMSQLAVLVDVREANSELSRINAAASASPQTCSAGLFNMLVQALDVAQATEGAYDPTIGPLLNFWQTHGVDADVAPVSDLRDALDKVGYWQLELSSAASTVFFKKPGMNVNLDGVAAGVMVDAAAGVLKQKGVTRAQITMGDVVWMISPPAEASWVLTWKDPLHLRDPLLSFECSNGAVALVSQMQRFKWEGYEKLTQEIDPRSGRPVPFEGFVLAAAPTAKDALAYARAFLAMGPAKAVHFCEMPGQPIASAYLIPRRQNWDETASKNFFSGGIIGKRRKK